MLAATRWTRGASAARASQLPRVTPSGHTSTPHVAPAPASGSTPPSRALATTRTTAAAAPPPAAAANDAVVQTSLPGLGAVYAQATAYLERVKAMPSTSALDKAYTKYAHRQAFTAAQGSRAALRGAAATLTTAPAVMTSLARDWYRGTALPRLTASARRDGIDEDTFGVWPTQQDASALDVEVLPTFEHCTWQVADGTGVAPQHAFVSPRVRIRTYDDRLRHFTLALTDLDRLSPNDRQAAAFCHWLVTDIPVTREAVIKGGASHVLAADQLAAVWPPAADAALEAKFAHLEPRLRSFPSPPAADAPREPLGREWLPYLPPHPPQQVPRQRHRFVLTLWEQPNGPLDLDPATTPLETLFGPEAVAAHQRVREPVAIPQRRLKAHEPGYVAPPAELHDPRAEELLRPADRLLAGPALRLAHAHGLRAAGVAWFSTTWSVVTSTVFEALQLHEPVLATVRDHQVREVIRKIHAAKTHMDGVDDVAAQPAMAKPYAPIGQDADMAAVNAGKPFVYQSPRLVTQRMVAHLKEEAAQREKSKKPAAPVPEPDVRPRQPRLSIIAQAARIKARQQDPAAQHTGPLTEKAMPRRSRFHNV